MIKKLSLIFLLALIIRLVLISVAFHGDLYNNLSWGQMALKGLNGFYERKGFAYSIPNQPPLYILLFGFTSFIYQTIYNLSWYLNNHFGFFPSAFIWFWQQNGNVILLKLPGIFADLGIGFLIYKFTKKISLTCLWLFNPISFYNSAIWGQTDSVVNLFGLISIFYLFKKDLVKSVLFFVISILFKGSLTIFLPVLIVVWILQKHKINDWMKAIIISGIFTVIVSIWFHPEINLPIWLLNLYTQRFFPGEIGYLTANAFNLWYLVNPGKILDNTKYFGVTAHAIGYLISLILGIILIYKKRKSLLKEKTILIMLAISALISFLFFTRIHERYLYPLFPIATILVGLIPEFIIPYVILSFVFLLNMYNLFWVPSIPFLQNIMMTSQLPTILSAVNLIIFIGVFVYV